MSDELGLGDFDATQYDTDTQRGDRKNLPDGIYRLEVSEAEVKDTKAGNGKILTGKIRVLAPKDHEGGWFFFNINLNNPNATAEKIGREELAKLCRAIGIKSPRTATELLFKAFTAQVGVDKGGKGYEPKNEVKTYFYPDKGDIPAPKIEPSTPAPANSNAPPATAAAAQPAKTRPWG